MPPILNLGRPWHEHVAVRQRFAVPSLRGVPPPRGGCCGRRLFRQIERPERCERPRGSGDGDSATRRVAVTSRHALERNDPAPRRTVAAATSARTPQARAPNRPPCRDRRRVPIEHPVGGPSCRRPVARAEEATGGGPLARPPAPGLP